MTTRSHFTNIKRSNKVYLRIGEKMYSEIQEKTPFRRIPLVDSDQTQTSLKYGPDGRL